MTARIVYSFDLTVELPTYHDVGAVEVTERDQLLRAWCGRVLTYMHLPELNAHPIRLRHAQDIGRPCGGCLRAGGFSSARVR